MKWALRADPNHYLSTYASIAFDSRSSSSQTSADSMGQWSVIVTTPSTSDRLWLQTPTGGPSNGTMVTYAFEAGAWSFSVDNGQPDSDQFSALRSAPQNGDIDADEMTLSVAGQIQGMVGTLEITDLILGTSQGAFDACPAVKSANDVVVTDDFQLSDDKKACRLPRLKFLVGGS